MNSASYAGAPPGNAERDHVLVRAGSLLCALPHQAPCHLQASPYRLRRVHAWRAPTPLPGVAAPLILGAAPLDDHDGIEHLHVIVDLASALGEPAGRYHSTSACILGYDNGHHRAGLAADALIRRVRLARGQAEPALPPARTGIPFVAEVRESIAADPHTAWQIIDLQGLMAHLVRILRVPEPIVQGAHPGRQRGSALDASP